ncbi:MAG TPA: FMN-binding protein [Desulfobacterales bacterium]|nr:FMN-binding protein [Desulfobacterales bacterium]
MEPKQPKPPIASTLERLKNRYIVQAWLVLILTLCFGGTLAGVQLTLGPIIETNKLNETIQRVPELILGADQARKMEKQGRSLSVEPLSLGVEKHGRKVFYNVYDAKSNGERIGWVVKASGQGYADKIELLIGLDPPNEKITGLFILEQKETPGLGNKIAADYWRSQFINKNVRTPLVVIRGGVKPANGIDAITGATISSRTVTNIINTAVSDLKEPLSLHAASVSRAKDEP